MRLEFASSNCSLASRVLNRHDQIVGHITEPAIETLTVRDGYLNLFEPRETTKLQKSLSLHGLFGAIRACNGSSLPRASFLLAVYNWNNKQSVSHMRGFLPLVFFNFELRLDVSIIFRFLSSLFSSPGAFSFSLYAMSFAR
jgi:hypothetical protein